MILRRAVLYAFFGVLTMFGLTRALAGQTPNSITAPVAPAVPQQAKTVKPTVYVKIQIREGAAADVVAAQSFMEALNSVDDQVDYQVGDPAPEDSSEPVVHLLGMAHADGKTGDDIFLFTILYHNENNSEADYIGTLFGFLPPQEADGYGKGLLGVLSEGVTNYLQEVAEEKASQ